MSVIGQKNCSAGPARACFRRMVRCLVFVALATACAGAPKKVQPGDPGEMAMKMRHQILFRFGEEAHVFEGYMILKKEAFFVKAFAGPGVDLFTLVRDGAWHREELHIGSLKDRIDLRLVSESIAKVYLGGCGGNGPPGETTCDFYGETMLETHGSGGALVRREFSSEQEGSLVIRYQEFHSCSGHSLPKQIALTWEKGNISMVIRLVACETLSHLEPDLWKR